MVTGYRPASPGALVKNLLLGYAVRLNGPMFPTTPGFDEKLPAYPFDPERAKSAGDQIVAFDIERDICRGRHVPANKTRGKSATGP